MASTPRKPRRPHRPRRPRAAPPELERYDADDPAFAQRILEPHYEVLRLLARGPVACTHLVRDREAGRELVARILRWEVAKDETARAHLRRLTRAGLTLDHPHIVRTFAMARDDEPVPWAICEFVDGTDLATLLQQGGHLPAANALRLAGQVAAALEAAHARGIVHGSLRPTDILVTPGVRAKIYEFDLPLFGDAGVLGSPRYAAPEQLQDPGSGAAAPADVFALGVILFEMLTGKDPFAAPTAINSLMRKVQGEIPAMPAAAGEAAALLRAMLAADPHRRPSASQVAAALAAEPA